MCFKNKLFQIMNYCRTTLLATLYYGIYFRLDTIESRFAKEAAPAAVEAEDSDVDLFGSDEEDDEENERLKVKYNFTQ